MGITSRSSPNYGERRGGRTPDLLLLHYTGMDTAEAATGWLCNRDAGVSCHYLVDEAGGIVQMVDEAHRAWHAGASCWAGESDINSCSIGIEIHNRGHFKGYSEFPDPQMEAVEALCLDILSRHEIPPWRVLAHSDVAPGRKIDPGEKFDWGRLHRAGVGHWTEPIAKGTDAGLKFGDENDRVRNLQSALVRYGYGVVVTGCYDAFTRTVVAAFQLHFRPSRINGVADRSTCDTLDALISGVSMRS